MSLERSDLRLIELLQEDGRKTLTSLGKELGISHVAVRKKLQKLMSEGISKVSALLNSKMFVYAIVITELESYTYFKNIAHKLKNCPRIVLLAPLIGGMGYIAVMAFENMDILESCMNICVVRTHKGIRRSEVLVSRELITPNYVPVKVVSKKGEAAPCGMLCGKCPLYKEGKCYACPATKYYRQEGLIGTST
ncbi:MAG TPA: AsnC family transcriptional regulator [Acidilobales archaeon]|nr:AsnC family transcriptional regulator [Acidilobales archaeon]